jgi:N-acetylglucosaminyldiphosphoundecaprenol N-acetyl-beta-D-mannosaminyltransferase
MEMITLVGVKINRVSLDELLIFLTERIVCDGKTIVSYVNIHAINMACETLWVRDFINQSDLSFCDGVGLQLAAALTGQKLEHRFTPPDFMERICEAGVQQGWRLYFLGAKPGVAARAADGMRSKFPGLQIESHHGYFDKTVPGSENKAVVKAINEFHPDILVVGFGMPLQERWILDNRGSLNVKVLVTAGALFDYLSGSLPRAPHWMTDNGLEWVGRLVVEPRRLWRRYLIGNPLFFMRLFAHHFLGRPLPE